MECWDRDSPSAVWSLGSNKARVGQELCEWQWVGIRVDYEFTATFPTTGNILARDTLHGGRGGMPVKCGDKLPCSSEQWLFLTSPCCVPLLPGQVTGVSPINPAP